MCLNENKFTVGKNYEASKIKFRNHNFLKKGTCGRVYAWKWGVALIFVLEVINNRANWVSGLTIMFSGQ